MKSYLLPILQALVTVALLAWIFSDPQVRADGALLWRQAEWSWVFLGLLAAGLSDLAGVLRWWICLGLSGLPVGLRRAVALYFMGRFSTLFLPGAVGGDAVKIAWLAVEFPRSRLGGVLAVLMDRLSGFAALIITGLTAVWLRADWLRSTPQTAGMVSGVLIFFAVSATGLVMWYIVGRERFRHRHPRWLPFRERLLKITGVFDLFFQDGRRAFAAIALSFVAMGSFFLTFYCAARAFGSAVPLADILTVMPLIDVITQLPVALNGLGLREKTFETLLGLLSGVPAGAAVLISLGGFALYSVWSLLGAPAFILYRTSPRREAVHA